MENIGADLEVSNFNESHESDTPYCLVWQTLHTYTTHLDAATRDYRLAGLASSGGQA